MNEEQKYDCFNCQLSIVNCQLLMYFRRNECGIGSVEFYNERNFSYFRL